MSTTATEELSRYFVQTDEPEIRARQRHIAEIMLKAYPEVGADLVQQGLEQGQAQGIDKGLAPILHLLERKLARNLTGEERLALHERLNRLGPDRLGDVVIDLDAPALATWLADPAAR